LSNDNKWPWWIRFTGCLYRRTCGSSRLAWSKDRRPPGAVLYSPHDPSELLQWLCHDDSTINIVVVIIIINYYYYSFPSPSVPFPSLALSILLPYSPPQIQLEGLGSAVSSPSGARKRNLTHLRVSKRTSWQHLSASRRHFPMTQNASYAVIPPMFRRRCCYVCV